MSKPRVPRRAAPAKQRKAKMSPADAAMETYVVLAHRLAAVPSEVGLIRLGLDGAIALLDRDADKPRLKGEAAAYCEPLCDALDDLAQKVLDFANEARALYHDLSPLVRGTQRGRRAKAA